VAELLGEYERRLASDANNSTVTPTTTTTTTTPDGTDDATARSDASSTGSGSGATATRVVSRRPPAVYNRDVIPSPKNSPLKTCPPLDQYIRSNKSSH